MCVQSPMHMCNMTHVYVWHDPFIFVTWLMYMCDVTHSYVWHDSIRHSGCNGVCRGIRVSRFHSRFLEWVRVCVALSCSVLHDAAVCCSVCCSVLQGVALCYGVLQCVADAALWFRPRFVEWVCVCVAVCCIALLCTAVCCSVLQCAAVCFSALQCTAVCCSVLQCVAVSCSVLQILQSVFTLALWSEFVSVLQCVAEYCRFCNPILHLLCGVSSCLCYSVLQSTADSAIRFYVCFVEWVRVCLCDKGWLRLVGSFKE